MSRTKNLTLLVAALLMLQGTLFGACALYRFAFPTPVILTSSSPAGTYIVTLTGQSDRPRFPAVIHTVSFSVVKDQKAFLLERYLHSGDWLDRRPLSAAAPAPPTGYQPAHAP